MTRNIFIILFAFSATVLFSQKGPYYQQAASYKMDIDVDAKNLSYNGTQTISYTNNSPENLDVVYFHLYWNAFKPGSMMDQRAQNRGTNGDSRLQKNGISRLASIPKDKEGAQNIHWIKQNGKTLKFEIQETIMKVYLDTPIKSNSTVSFQMEWDAKIPMQIRRSGSNNSEGIEMTMSQWYPKIAEYDYDGWATFDYVGREFHAPFADFDVTIKLDQDYIIGAGGTLENPTEVKGYVANSKIKTNKQKKASWHWTAKNILDFAWAADKDYFVDSIDVPQGPKVYLVYQKSEKTKYWEEAKPYISRYFTYMNENFGKYVYPSYAFIQGGDGGMEYGMCTMILGEAKSVEDLTGLMVHEGAHSWYQQMLATNENTKPWMDEGFTSYAEEIVMNQLFPPAQPLPNPHANRIAGYSNFVKSGKEEPASWLADHHDNGTAYTYATYVKGQLYLVQLGYIVGEQNLAKIMMEYYNEWKLKHPTDRDFLHIAQKISGMDLKWFNHYWINTTKTIDYAIKDVKYNATSTTITLERKGDIPMPIDFSIITKDRKLTTYQIPLNMTRTWKKEDAFGDFKILEYWAWTQKEYTFTIPFAKDQIAAGGIDVSQRMADVNPENNFFENK